MLSTSMTLYLIFCCAFILLVWGALVPFRAGLLYNGTVYCMAVGGYFAAFAAKELGWPFFLCVLGAAVVGAILGFLPALGFSRTSGVVTRSSATWTFWAAPAVSGASPRWSTCCSIL